MSAQSLQTSSRSHPYSPTTFKSGSVRSAMGLFLRVQGGADALSGVDRRRDDLALAGWVVPLPVGGHVGDDGVGRASARGKLFAELGDGSVLLRHNRLVLLQMSLEHHGCGLGQYDAVRA